MSAPWQQLAEHADASLAAQDAMVDERVLLATVAARLQDYDTALKLLNEALMHNPQHFALYELRATCCLHAGRHEQALDDALHCTTLNPDWARGWTRLGAAQLCCSHARASVSAYTRALALDPGSKEAHKGLQLAQEALLRQGGRRMAAHHEAA